MILTIFISVYACLSIIPSNNLFIHLYTSFSCSRISAAILAVINHPRWRPSRCGSAATASVTLAIFAILVTSTRKMSEKGVGGVVEV